MDGAFRPNDLLDLAQAVLEAPAPDCLAATSLGLVVTSDRSLLSVDRPGGSELASFERPISAVTGLPDGGAAAALIDGAIVFVGGQRGGTTLAPNPEVACITALAPAADGSLLVANGSATNRPDAWKRDLMEKERVRLRLARRPGESGLHAPGGRSGLPLWPARGRRLDRRLGELAQRADADFSRRRRSQ